MLDAGIPSIRRQVRPQPGALAKVGAPQRAARVDRRNLEMSANDRRFLRSLRIAADEAQSKEVE